MAEAGQEPAWKQKSPSEIERQLNLNKSVSAVKGSVYFSARTLAQNPMRIRQLLSEKFYQNPCLPPVVDDSKRNAPEPVYGLEYVKNKRLFTLSWQYLPENKEKEAVKFLVYAFSENDRVDLDDATKIYALTGETHIDLSRKEARNLKTVVIRAVSRNNDLSDPTSYHFMAN